MLACLLLAISLAYVSAWDYPESVANGWTDTCDTGTRQSPINFDSSMGASVHAPIEYRNYFNGYFNKYFKRKLLNNGHTVQWHVNKDTSKLYGGASWKTKCPSVRQGPYGGATWSHAFYLWQFHFHWSKVGESDKGSEHTVDGDAYPLEVHLVHVNAQFIEDDGTVDIASAAANPDGLAVIGIFFKVDPKKSQNAKPLSDVDDAAWQFHDSLKGLKKRKMSKEITEEELEEEKRAYHDHKEHEMNMKSLAKGFKRLARMADNKDKKRANSDGETVLSLNVGAFIRKATNNGADKTMSTYWTYKGSLTTPACQEVVTWVVFDRALPIAQVQVNAFASLFKDNYREAREPVAEHAVQRLIHNQIKVEGGKTIG